MKQIFHRIFLAAFSLLLCALLLGGCAGRLPEGMDADELTGRATAIVDAVNARDWALLTELYGTGKITGTGYERPTEEEWAELLGGILDGFGAFEKVLNTSYLTVDDETLGEMVIVLVEAQYENERPIWQVSFIQGYELAGLRL